MKIDYKVLVPFLIGIIFFVLNELTIKSTTELSESFISFKYYPIFYLIYFSMMINTIVHLYDKIKSKQNKSFNKYYLFLIVFILILSIYYSQTIYDRHQIYDELLINDIINYFNN